jgi:hypothetical protein
LRDVWGEGRQEVQRVGVVQPWHGEEQKGVRVRLLSVPTMELL